MQRAVAHAYQREDHGHLYSNGEDAQCGANRTVREVGEGEFIKQSNRF